MIRLEGIDLLELQSALDMKKTQGGATVLLDPLRKNYVPATPEEIVRQLWIRYFLDVMLLGKKLIAVERAFHHNGMSRRFDLVIYDRNAKPLLLAEFKGPGIHLQQSVFDQIARYNMELQVPFSLVSNGREHYYFEIDEENRRFIWHDKLVLSL